MSKTVTTSHIQSPPEDSSFSTASEAPSPFENSKLIGRVSSYSLVHKLFETTQYLYTRAKDSHQIVKTGLQTAEQTLQWANSQPPVVRVERALLNYVDDFGCRQLDHLDQGVVRAQELYNTDYVHAAKTKGSELLHASKDLVDSKVLQPGRDKVEELRHKSWTEILEPVTSRVAPVASTVGQKTVSLVRSGRDTAYSTTLGVVERVLPCDDETSTTTNSNDDELSTHVDQVSDFSSRVRSDASVIQQRLQRKLLQQLRTLNIRLNTPERIEQLQRNSVDLIHYASEYLHNLQDKASEKLAPVRERLPSPPPAVSRVVESSRTRLEALRTVAWQRARALFLSSSQAALAYLPPALLATVNTTKNNLIDFIYDVPQYQARHQLPSKSSLLYNHDSPREYEEEDSLTEQQQQQEVFQPVPVYTRPQYEVPALVNRLGDQVNEEEEEEEYKSDDNKQDDDVEPDQE